MISEYWPIEKLSLWDRNPRNIKDERFNALKDRIKRQGQIKPLLVTKDGTVIGGNMRLRAMRDIGISEVWVNVVDATTDKEIFDLALTDNEEFGYYEQEQVAELALELGLSPIELESYALNLGSPTTLDLIVDKFGPELEEDELPELDETKPPESKLGEIYQLGRHRLMCGDATKLDDVGKLMDGARADAVVTDPPYNTGMTSKSQVSNTLRRGSGKRKNGSTRLTHMFNDSFTPEEFDKLLNESLNRMHESTKSEATFYVFIDWRQFGAIKMAVEKLLKVSNVIVWDKVVHGLGSDYKYTYELIVVGKKGSPEIHNRIDRDYQDVWHHQRAIGRNDDHATAKPVALIEKPIKHATKQGDIVLDVFGGSGTTLIACETTNRICYMMELDPKYCDVIRRRYWKHVNGTEDGWENAT